MNYKLTASAVLCAAFVSGCSSAPTLAVPTGEWESFNQQPQPPQLPRTYAQQPLMPPAGFNQGATTTVFKPNEVVAFTPPPGSTPVKPAVATIVLPVEKPPVTPAQKLASNAPALPLPAPTYPSKTAQVAPSLQPASLAPSKPANTVPDKQKLPASSPPAPILPSIPAAPAPKPPKVFKVSPEDKTIRETLAKWARAEGWTFNPIGRQHWAVAEDFDVVASDTMHGSFIEVVQQLIASTELTKTPLQPCFYKNKVVRVIYINEQCSNNTAQLRNR